MQISGKLIILAAFGMALALSGGAWWYHYEASNRAAEFWGASTSRMLVKAPQAELLELEDTTADNNKSRQLVAGRSVLRHHELTGKPGLIHLRFVFTQDDSFEWSQLRRQPLRQSDWPYALRFTDGEESSLVLLAPDFASVGKPEGGQVVVLPSPRIAEPVRRYLTDVGVLQRSQDEPG